MLEMTRNRTAISTGRRGEKMAVEYLRGQRYIILEVNYRKPYGEVDIVARDGNTLVFIEVKTRHTLVYGTPFEAVDSRKQRQISRVAQEYLQVKGLNDCPARFDVVAVLLDRLERPSRIDHIKNAFDFAL